jgi:peptidoglycan/LPS O-acetylase OafA/YrhL
MKNNRQLAQNKYRADIDGLRAIAVLAVVGYHAFPNIIKGGFIGVDIFFVISGFLISTILFETLENGTFSFLGFYARRIRRIFPALLVVLVTCFVFGWFTLFVDEYKQLGKHIAGGAGFVSNFLLWGESGYFDNAAATKPLLHLWSLGIEEQFYIIWPLLLWSAYKLRFNFLIITVVVALISFALNIKGVETESIATFYSLQTRFWELLCGSLLAWLTIYKKNFIIERQARSVTLCDLLSVLGFILIAYGLYRITKNVYFPGYWALVPTIGTVLIISAGSKALLNRVLLSNKLLVWIGLISFPLYLWHWPLLSFARIIEGNSLTNINIHMAAVVVSFVLAWFTYRLIEKPVRFGNVGDEGKVKSTTLLVLMIIIGCVGYNTYQRDGLQFRSMAKKFNAYEKLMITSDKRQCIDLPYAHKKDGDWFCKIGNSNIAPTIFAYGDSHAFSLLPALEKLAADKNISILFQSQSGCLPLLGVRKKLLGIGSWLAKHNCSELNNRIFNYVKNNDIKNVFLISYWIYYPWYDIVPTNEITEFAAKYNEMHKVYERSMAIGWLDYGWLGGPWYSYGIYNTVQKYKRLGVNLYIFEDVPTQKLKPRDAIRKALVNGKEINQFSISKTEHQKKQKYISEKFSKLNKKSVNIINLDDLLCVDGTCSIEIDGSILYSGTNHLSVSGALVAYPKIKETFNSLKK